MPELARFGSSWETIKMKMFGIFLALFFVVAATDAEAGLFDSMVTNAVKKAAEPALRGDSEGVNKAVTGSVVNDVNHGVSNQLRARGNRPAAEAMDVVNSVEQSAIRGVNSNPSSPGDK